MEWGKIYNDIVEKANEDSGFRKMLFFDPKQALKDELGIEIDSGVNIRVVESTPDHLQFVLPSKKA